MGATVVLDGQEVSISYRTVRIKVVDILPGPQGSKSFKGMRGGKPILVESSDKVEPWRNAVALHARVTMGSRAPFTGPCIVGLSFRFRRPRSHFTTKGVLKESAPRMMTVPPDLDKLLRSTCDALTDVVWKDDALVVGFDPPPHKLYDDWTGCEIVVREVVFQGPQPLTTAADEARCS